MAMVIIMLLHLYSAFSIWIYSNALYNTVEDFSRLLCGSVHNLFTVTSRIHSCPQNRISDARPQHRELHAQRGVTRQDYGVDRFRTSHNNAIVEEKQFITHSLAYFTFIW